MPLGPTLPFTDSLFEPVGLNAYVPDQAAGILTDPPESDPKPKAETDEATSVPSPPDEPPLKNLGLNGFLETP